MEIEERLMYQNTVLCNSQCTDISMSPMLIRRKLNRIRCVRTSFFIMVIVKVYEVIISSVPEIEHNNFMIVKALP